MMDDNGDLHQDSDHPGHGRDHNGHAGHGVDHSGHEEMFRRRFWVSLVLSLPVILYSETIQGWLGYTAPAFPGSDWLTPLLSIVVFAYGGIPFFQMAVPEVRKRTPGMMTLISLAIGVAFVYSLVAVATDIGEPFFWELVTLIDVMLLGHWIEMRSVRQARRALDELAQLMPDTAERVTDDGVEEVPVADLRQGDVVLVRPGGSIPADGTVVEGESAVNESMITGESRPVDKTPGDQVIAGTVNRSGSLRVEVTATGDETALSGIMRLVEEAQASKSETQLLADRAAGYLFYAALGVAAVTAVAWGLAVGPDTEVVRRVVTVLVIACPHALGLAVPLVVAITTAMASSNGFLIRDRLALEKARLVDTVIFDKTGTLTQGEFGVADVAVAEGENEEHVLALAAAIEGDSEHTIAAGIRAAADERGLNRDLPKVSDFEALEGRGVRARRDGKDVYVGSPGLLEDLGLSLSPDLESFTTASGEKARTVVYVIEADRILGALALADLVRSESRQAIEALHRMGLKVNMLTGDSEDVAAAVAKELGIDGYFAEVRPEQKDDKVSQLQREGRVVAMVGDGVNDAPALSRADVGIAIGSGTDVAVESAGIILVQNDPRDVVEVIRLSKASHQKMVENLWWASGYNIVALPLAAGVLAPWGINLSPAVGALLMSLSTVIVAINARRLQSADIALEPDAA